VTEPFPLYIFKFWAGLPWSNEIAPVRSEQQNSSQFINNVNRCDAGRESVKTIPLKNVYFYFIIFSVVIRLTTVSQNPYKLSLTVT